MEWDLLHPRGLWRDSELTIDNSDRLTRSLLGGTKLHLLFLRFAPSFAGAVGRNVGGILNLDVLLGAGEDLPHLGDLMLRQVLVK